MIVRDRTHKIADYKGRPTDACDAACPCRPCYNAHDCGWRATDGEWVVSMECATRANQGCPHPLPEPEHLWNCRHTRCKRCGQRGEAIQ